MKYFFVFFLFFSLKTKAQVYGNVNEKFLKAVVSIEKNKSIGTGFIIGVAEKNMKHYFLVTNKHMIGEWSLIDSFIPVREIRTKFYTNDSKSPFLKTTISISDEKGKLKQNVMVHPNPKVDVAVIHFPAPMFSLVPTKFEFVILDSGFLVRIDSIKSKTQLGLGSMVFSVGYPKGMSITSTNEPMIKTGFVASSFTGNLKIIETWTSRKDTSKFFSAENDTKYFLIDGGVVPGNSGGPLLASLLPSIGYANGRIITRNPNFDTNQIIGIISNYRPSNAIATVYATDYILELIQSLLSKFNKEYQK